MKAFGILCVFAVGCAHSASTRPPALPKEPEDNIIFGDAHLSQNLVTAAQIEDNENPYKDAPEPTPAPAPPPVVKPATRSIPSVVASAMISVECDNPYDDPPPPVDEREEVRKSFEGCPVGDPLCATIER